MYLTLRHSLMSAVCAGLLLVGAPAATLAQEEISEEHLAAARDTVRAANAIRAFDDILPLMADRTRTLFIQSNPANTQQIDAVVNEVALEMADRRPELNRLVYEVWARRFSVEELKELEAFYETDLGQKYSRLEPEMRALSIGAAKQWGDAISTEMVTVVRERLGAALQAPDATGGATQSQ